MNIHVSEEVTPRLRGEEFGRAHAEQVRHTVEVVAWRTLLTDGLLRLTVRPSGMPQIS